MIRMAYFDMDGLLADFTGAALAVHGATIPVDDISWNFFEQIGITEEQFWAPLRNRGFWANIPPLNDGFELLSKVVGILGWDRIAICSNVACVTSADGKMDWLRRYVPALAKRAVFTTSKGICAYPGAVLLDDYEKNIRDFAQNGGRTILIPRTWNSRKPETKQGAFDVLEVFKQVVRMNVHSL